MTEFMSKTAPFLFDQCFESLDSTIVSIEHELRQRSQLRSPIPAVRAMYQNGRFVIFQFVNYPNGSVHNQLQQCTFATQVTDDQKVKVRSNK